MCSVFEKFKLCSCASIREEEIKGRPYWILYRYTPETIFTQTLGELRMLMPFDPEKEEENKETLLSRLNDSNPFDFEPGLKEKDLLVLHFGTPKEGYRELSYSYVFKGGKWQFRDVSVFDIENDYRPKGKGKIEKQES